MTRIINCDSEPALSRRLLEGPYTELAKLTGQKVTVKGILKGDTLSILEVVASK
jgi:hypothetical protein